MKTGALKEDKHDRNGQGTMKIRIAIVVLLCLALLAGLGAMAYYASLLARVEEAISRQKEIQSTLQYRLYRLMMEADSLEALEKEDQDDRHR